MSSIIKHRKSESIESKQHPVEGIIDSTSSKRGRPVVRRGYTKRNINFDNSLWERLELAAILRNTSITELLHEAARTYISGNFSQSDLDTLAELRRKQQQP